MSEKITKKQDIDKYKNRRRMAWISFYFVLFYTMLIFFVPAESAKKMIEVLSPLLLFFGSIIGAYIGSSTINDKWELENK